MAVGQGFVPRQAHPFITADGRIDPTWLGWLTDLAPKFVDAGDPGVIPVVKVRGFCIGWANDAPTSATWAQGDVIWNSEVEVGDPNGWRCTVAGTPGTWVAMANL